jgi:hypothetical protein
MGQLMILKRGNKLDVLVYGTTGSGHCEELPSFLIFTKE